MVDLATTMAAMRGVHMAATLSLLGAGGFVAWILPAATPVPQALHRRLVRVCRISGLLALLAGVAWLVLQTAAMAGAQDLSDLLDALPVVAAHTRFGTILLARLTLVLVATILGCYGWRRYPCLVLAASALGLQGMIGHAGATAGAIGDGLVLSEALHLVAASIWLGALLPLCISLRSLPAVQTALVAERFSPIGLGCVVVLAGSGFAQGFELIGSLPALFGTRYGQLAVLKIVLFLIALVLAACNRLWLTDRLATERVMARRHMLVSVCVETLIGLVIVSAAALMASSPPAAHTTPVWPFAWRFTLATVTEDADFRQEVIVSLLLIGGAVGLMLFTLLWRRFRLPALLVLALVVILRGSSLTLLTAAAYPTSFQTSPTGFAASSIVRGQQLYGPNCGRLPQCGRQGERGRCRRSAHQAGRSDDAASVGA